MNRRSSIMSIAVAQYIFAANGRWEPPHGDRKQWRRKKKDGTWEYSPTPPEGADKTPEEKSQPRKEIPAPVEKENVKKPAEDDKVTGEKPKDQVIGEKPDQKKEEPKEKKSKPKLKHRVKLTSESLKNALSHGHFAIISAGRNGDDPKEKDMKPDDPFFHKRHDELRAELEKNGMPYTEVVGHYTKDHPEITENSFIVFHDDVQLTEKTVKSFMLHHKDKNDLKQRRKVISELGKKFNQNSVLFGSGGKNSLEFTTGEHQGKTCGGKGWNEAPEAENYFTDIDLKDKKHTKVQLDISECFKKGQPLYEPEVGDKMEKAASDRVARIAGKIAGSLVLFPMKKEENVSTSGQETVSFTQKFRFDPATYDLPRLCSELFRKRIEPPRMNQVVWWTHGPQILFYLKGGNFDVFSKWDRTSIERFENHKTTGRLTGEGVLSTTFGKDSGSD